MLYNMVQSITLESVHGLNPVKCDRHSVFFIMLYKVVLTIDENRVAI